MVDAAVAFLEARSGRVVLRKFQLPGRLTEPIPSGAIALAPGASDHGVIPLGRTLEPRASNFWIIRGAQPQRILTVVLEVGFTEQRATDRPIPPSTHVPFSRFFSIEKERQEIVRSPELRWW